MVRLPVTPRGRHPYLMPSLRKRSRTLWRDLRAARDAVLGNPGDDAAVEMLLDRLASHALERPIPRGSAVAWVRQNVERLNPELAATLRGMLDVRLPSMRRTRVDVDPTPPGAPFAAVSDS